MTVTITLQPDHHLTWNKKTYDWDYQIEATLRGSIKTKISDDAFSFTERWSGASIDGVISGGFVTQITVYDAVRPNPWAGRHDWTVIPAMVIDLTPGTFEASDLLSGFKRFIRKADHDPFRDLAGDEVIFKSLDSLPERPERANSEVQLGPGDDIITLFDGGSYIDGSQGNDHITGGDGLDFILYNYETLPDTSKGIKSRIGAEGTWEIVKPDGSVDTLDRFEGFAGTDRNDILKANLGAPAHIAGLGGHDRIGGSAYSDRLMGGDGNDRIFGRGGHDELYGGPGPDIIRGGPGNDVIHVNGNHILLAIESDQLYGNGGRDVFVLKLPYVKLGDSVGFDNGPAVIHDFTDGWDFIAIKGPTTGTYRPTRFSDLAIRQDGSDTIIAYAGYDLARLKEMDAADLTRADVIGYTIDTNFALHWEYGL